MQEASLINSMDEKKQTIYKKIKLSLFFCIISTITEFNTKVLKKNYLSNSGIII